MVSNLNRFSVCEKRFLIKKLMSKKRYCATFYISYIFLLGPNIYLTKTDLKKKLYIFPHIALGKRNFRDKM